MGVSNDLRVADGTYHLQSGKVLESCKSDVPLKQENVGK